MTYSFSNETFCWPGMTPFNMTQVYFPNVTRDGFYAIMYDFHTSDRCGTHIEAPRSLYKDKRSTGEIPLDDLIGPAVVIDVRQKTLSNLDYQLMPSDIEDWEEKHGRIPEGVILLVLTGWGKFFSDNNKYLGMQPAGNVSNMHFPGKCLASVLWSPVDICLRGSLLRYLITYRPTVRLCFFVIVVGSVTLWARDVEVVVAAKR